jgi:hypothetical protein
VSGLSFTPRPFCPTKLFEFDRRLGGRYTVSLNVMVKRKVFLLAGIKLLSSGLSVTLLTELQQTTDSYFYCSFSFVSSVSLSIERHTILFGTVYTYTHTYPYTRTHIPTHTHTHTYIYIQTHTHTYTTHTHTYIYIYIYICYYATGFFKKRYFWFHYNRDTRVRLDVMDVIWFLT